MKAPVAVKEGWAEVEEYQALGLKKELILNFNKMEEDVRTRYFSNLISENQRNLRFLFKTINQ